MSWVESIQKAIDYIETNLLNTSLSIEQIAKVTNSSVFHFQRTFSILTDSTVGDYIRRRRLTLAAEELINTEEKIIDLSYKYGYETPEAFTKAFRKQHGITPTDARKKKGSIQSYNRLIIQISLKGAEPMNYKIIEKDAFQIVGVKRTYNCQNGENTQKIPVFWDDVHADGTNNRLIELNNGAVNGVLGVCIVEEEQKSLGLMDYWIATNHEGDVPEGLLAYEIPPSKWVIFEVHGPMPHAMQETWKKIYSEWFPSNPYQPAGSAELEVYSNDDPSKTDYYSEIWIPIK
ncbi:MULTISPECIES: GyrI-like domain-containing protein [Lysinibacillus]|uniref:Helix-turn-helix domain-containing protein n=1 Tax=Lysinibacillus antri TaxID=2498145 RepID=A0A432LCF6_9BACI|nr:MULTISPECIES: GyrI-like domain-containing protein [Lysinibacillus]RUL53603.1 helix-turn-helix domain-containing protein [Lysinibacillus antri]TSI06167.1 helix-turn-helix domain-containing protein [Lysinibacillus sp. BW-2-10]